MFILSGVPPDFVEESDFRDVVFVSCGGDTGPELECFNVNSVCVDSHHVEGGNELCVFHFWDYFCWKNLRVCFCVCSVERVQEVDSDHDGQFPVIHSHPVDGVVLFADHFLFEAAHGVYARENVDLVAVITGDAEIDVGRVAFEAGAVDADLFFPFVGQWRADPCCS